MIQRIYNVFINDNIDNDIIFRVYPNGFPNVVLDSSGTVSEEKIKELFFPKIRFDSNLVRRKRNDD